MRADGGGGGGGAVVISVAAIVVFSARSDFINVFKMNQLTVKVTGDVR